MKGNNSAKRVFSSLLCLVLLLALLPPLNVQAAFGTVDVVATLDKTTLEESTSDQTITLTITAASPIVLDGVEYQIKADWSGWDHANDVKSTSGVNGTTFSGADIGTKDGNYYIGWTTDDSENITTDKFGVFEIKVPAGTPAGTYKVQVLGLETTKDYGEDGYRGTAEATLTITGGATTYTVTVSNDGNGTGAANPTSGATGTEVTLTATPNTGYKFKEWQVVSGGVTVADNKFKIGTANVEVKAIFEKTPATYTVSFDANGGTGTMADATVTEGEKYTLPACTFTAPAGKEFDKWDKGAVGAQIDVTADTTIKAEWKDTSVVPTTYTVTFNRNGHGTAPATQNVESGKTATKPADPTATGWKFEGWYKQAACTEEFDFTTPITANTTVYAKWTKESVTPVTYTVTFNANGHGTAPATQTVESGKKATKPADLTASGYTFGGWYKEAACTNVFDFNAPITANTTVYAKWTKNSTPPPTPGPTPTPSHDCPSKHLKDVDITQWYHEGVDYVVARKLMIGITADKFAPNATTTRAMIVTILYRLEGEPAVTGSSSFSDVEANTWYTKAVAWAEANKIVNGYDNGKFGPNDAITREQMAAIMYRYAGFKGYNVSKSADLSVFTDNGAVSSYALDAMKWAVAEELFRGVGDNLISPNTSATRAQVATILMRYIQNVK